MKLTLRPGKAEDAPLLGEICFNAFSTISHAHHFPPDIPSVEVAQGHMAYMLSLPEVHSVVAELDGKIVGSNFLWEMDSIAGVGPITVDPQAQNSGAGRLLMKRVMERAAQKKFPGVRLVQAAYHNRSLSLYTKLGFEVREPLATMTGQPLKKSLPGCTVRPATLADWQACNELCRQTHGHDRANELRAAINEGKATVCERGDALTGYATGIGFFCHAVAASNDDLKALIAGAVEFSGPGFLLPTRNSEVFRWCLKAGLRVVQPMTLMSRGLYNEPKNPFLPSILF